MIVRMAFLLTILLGSGCVKADDQLSNEEQQKIEDVIRNGLKDPESAHFKWDMTTFSIDPTNGYGQVCLGVNAKNGFGGYVRYQPAWVTFFKVKDHLEGISIARMGDEATVSSCNNIRESIEAFKHHDPRVTDDQARAGCSILDGKLFCASPGTGMCWEKGHNPWKGEVPARSISVGNGPESPDYNHPERCG